MPTYAEISVSKQHITGFIDKIVSIDGGLFFLMKDESKVFQREIAPKSENDRKYVIEFPYEDTEKRALNLLYPQLEKLQC